MTVFACTAVCDLWQNPTTGDRVTQLWHGRTFKVLDRQANALYVQSLEDAYCGWLRQSDYTATDWQPRSALSRSDIVPRLAQVFAYAEAAAQQENVYLWGGTAGPNYDCSGLIQRSFAAADIRVPRDAFQQAAFCQAIALSELEAGDLIFFQSGQRVDHVALYGGDNRYLHSSGASHGHNGIAWDALDGSSAIAQYYASHLVGCGRLMQSLAYPCDSDAIFTL